MNIYMLFDVPQISLNEYHQDNYIFHF